MKRDKILSGLVACLLSVGIAMGGVGCMVTGLQLPLESLESIALVCAITAALCYACTFVRHGELLLLCAAALIGGYLWREGTLALHLEALVYRISYIYDAGYGWGTIRWSDAVLTNVPMDMAVGLIACVCTAVICLNLCVRSIALLSVTVGFLPLATCMVVTDSVPDAKWLFLLLSGQLLLMVTNTVRYKDRAAGVRLTALLLIPAILAMSLVFHTAPALGQQGPLSSAQNAILSWIYSLPFVTQGPNGDLIISGGTASPDDTDLTTVGPYLRQFYPVMDVSSDYTGVLYLRGTAYDTYDGKSWVASSSANIWPGTGGRKEIGQITVTTREALPLRYFPYYPAGDLWKNDFGKGYMKNPDGLTKYSFQVTELDEQYYLDMYPDPPEGLPDDWFYSFSTGGYFSSSALGKCLELSESTKKAALTYLQGQDFSSLLPSEKAQLICSIVSQSAIYSLSTPRMPADEADFALWFLQDSNTGYCIHFATAATVLLRAIGVPARYVTGYATQVYAGQTTTVNASRAHAWVEYFDKATSCWRPIDPTPAEEGSTNPGTVPSSPAPTEPPDVTETPTEPPDVTEAPTKPTGVTEPSTKPTDATVPVQTDPPDTPAPDIQSNEQTGIPPLLIWIGGIVAALAALLFGQYRLRRYLRKKQQRTGRANARALAMWREAVRYCCILKAEPPEALLTLAEKAKFSQHTLTGQELGEFTVWLQQAKTALHKKSPIIRIFWMLVLAVE